MTIRRPIDRFPLAVAGHDYFAGLKRRRTHRFYIGECHRSKAARNRVVASI
jgi:hypothetical protein